MPSEKSQAEATIRTVELQDAPFVSRVILEMLADSPLAFGETLVEAQSRTDQDWLEFVQHLITPPVRTAFLAHDEKGVCGFVCVDSALAEAPPNTAVVSRLWVAPRQRGSGLGRRLMEIVTEWAREKRAGLLALGVTEMNIQAMDFYEHLGYTDTGMRFPWPPDPRKQIIVLGHQVS